MKKLVTTAMAVMMLSNTAFAYDATENTRGYDNYHEQFHTAWENATKDLTTSNVFYPNDRHLENHEEGEYEDHWVYSQPDSGGYDYEADVINKLANYVAYLNVHESQDYWDSIHKADKLLIELVEDNIQDKTVSLRDIRQGIIDFAKEETGKINFEKFNAANEGWKTAKINPDYEPPVLPKGAAWEIFKDLFRL